MHQPKLNVGIIGTGNIGTDLLLKIMRAEHLQCTLFAGRNSNSLGMKKARSLGINTSDQSIHAFIESPDICDLVFDATSAKYHLIHAKIFESLSIKAIDLTPAKVGPFCVPSIDQDVIATSDNINMVTCGGQASIPILDVLSKHLTIEQASVASFLSRDSVGQGTLDNIDQYYSTTAQAITHYTGIKDVTIDLRTESGQWKPDMLTSIKVKTGDQDIAKIFVPLAKRLQEIRTYVPGYHIIGTPSYSNGYLEITISIRGQGDWLPTYAGNLDIINCAAIMATKYFQKNRNNTLKVAV